MFDLGLVYSLVVFLWTWAVYRLEPWDRPQGTDSPRGEA
jgi:hypothetical protein